MKKITILILTITAFLASSFIYSTAKADSSDLWAVVVGVNGGDATHLDNDAIDFANVLTSVYGYPSANVRLLTNEEATKTNVTAAFDWLKNQESNSSGVSIFLSAHGSQDRIHLYDDYLWDYELSTIISQLESQSILVVITACHSGSFTDVADSISIGILTTACAADESTYDIALFANTIYVEYFVDRGMSQGLADEDQDGIVTVEEAHQYATENCVNPPGALSPTHPQIEDKYPGQLNLSEPIHAPWFTSLPLSVLAATLLVKFLRRKQAPKT